MSDYKKSAVKEQFRRSVTRTIRRLPSTANRFKELNEEKHGPILLGNGQDFYEIRDKCLQNGTLWEDPDFPATVSSLMYSKRPDRQCEWLRPNKITNSPKFFVEGYSRFDIQQGELGDCWLLAAAASLTQNQALFSRVVPSCNNSFEIKYAGIFHFRFWQFGKWVDVAVDDRLPTFNGKLIYTRSTQQNEFWSVLLEKAYAKLHGSYEALSGGNISEAMVDFSGGVAEMYNLNEAPENLFAILEKSFLRDSMTGCSIEPDPNVFEAQTPQGLIRGHAYTITKVQMVDIKMPNVSGKIPLIRLRNPWGNGIEWNGAWSDKSPEWRFISDKIKKEIGLTFEADGEYWISYRDFLKYFDSVEICNLCPSYLGNEGKDRGKLRWETSTFEGEWTIGSTAGGCRNYLDTFWYNPQYVIQLKEPDKDEDDEKCTVIVALMQKNRRSRRNIGVECLTIGFTIYNVTEKDLLLKPLKLNFFKYHTTVARSLFINLREVSCRFRLPIGKYVIVPSTFEPNEESEFLIRVYSECKNNMQENDITVEIKETENNEVANNVVEPLHPTEPQLTKMEKLFIEVAGKDKEVDWMELKQLLDYSFKDEFPKLTTLSKITKADSVEANTRQISHIIDNNKVRDDDASDACNILSLICCTFCRTKYERKDYVELEATRTPLDNVVTPIETQNDKDFEFTKDACRSMVAMLDADRSGKLGFEEFKSLLAMIAKWRSVFKTYDSNNTGRLSSFQLRYALGSAGYHLNNRILNSLVHRYASRDGNITIDDFLLCAIKIKTMMDVFKSFDKYGQNMATFSIDEWIEKTVYS